MFGFNKKSAKSAAEKVEKYNKAASRALTLNKVSNVAFGTSAATGSAAVLVQYEANTTKMPRKQRKAACDTANKLAYASIVSLGIGGVTKVAATIATPVPQIDLGDFDEPEEDQKGAEPNAQ